jgi:hypothetical protein
MLGHTCQITVNLPESSMDFQIAEKVHWFINTQGIIIPKEEVT